MAYLSSQRVNIGAEGTQSLVTSTNPMPITTQNESAFGETLVASTTPFVQSVACYNFLPANMTTYTASNGTATVTGGEFVCQTGTSSGGYGVIRSLRTVNYKGGMGAIFRGTGRFTPGVANSLQGVGFFNVGDGYLFGYSGTTFGIIYQHGGLPEVRTLTLALGSSASTNATVVLNGASYTIPLTSGTTAHNAFEIATYLTANQTAFNCFQNGATVLCSAISDGAKAGAFTFSHATATGSWARTTTGITKTTDVFARTAWNIDTCDWIDPTKGNVFQIKIQYLGYGAIVFYVEQPETGRFIPVHRIAYANAHTTPSVGNPSMHAGVFAASLGSTTNLTTASACIAAFIEGVPGRTRNPRGFSNNKTISTTPTEIFSLRDRFIIGGVPNQIEIEPVILTVFTESTKGAKIGIYSNPTLGGEPNWAYLNSVNLVSETDIAATTVTGGVPLMEFQISGNSSAVIDLTPLRIRYTPGGFITIAASVNSGNSADTGAALTWYEDL